MSGPALILGRAQARKSGESKPHDYDVLEGDRDVVVVGLRLAGFADLGATRSGEISGI